MRSPQHLLSSHQNDSPPVSYNESEHKSTVHWSTHAIFLERPELFTDQLIFLVGANILVMDKNGYGIRESRNSVSGCQLPHDQILVGLIQRKSPTTESDSTLGDNINLQLLYLQLEVSK